MLKCRFCGKEFANKSILGGHTSHCEKNPNYEINLLFLRNLQKNRDFSSIKHKGEKSKCKYCGKEYNFYGLKNHEKYCDLNPNKIEWKGNPNFSNRNHKSWNKGLTVETDSRVAKYVNTRKQHFKEGKFQSWEKGLTKETDERIRNHAEQISKTCLKKSQEGTWHKSLAKHMHYNYKGIDLDGTWELEYAKYLDNHNIKWIRPKDRFEYIFEGKIRYYTPDFYLVDHNLFIEIKGYKTKKDEAKWSQFPEDKNLQILRGRDLKNLGLEINI